MAIKRTSEMSAFRILRMTDVGDESLEFLMPIYGPERVALVSLEEAVEPLEDLIPDIKGYVYTAKQRCIEPADGLTQDEAASITLYTMGWDPMDECLYYVLNRTLRIKDKQRQEKIKPWYSYLRLFLNALSRLPPIEIVVYRGVKADMSKEYVTGKTIVWWGFSSCSKTLGVLQSDIFLGQTGPRTIFTIKCRSARNIRNHSYFENEDEMLLLAATQFKVISSLIQGDLNIIQLDEVLSTEPLLKLPPIIVTESSSITKSKIDLNKQKVNSMTLMKDIHILKANQLNIPTGCVWSQNGVTVAGGNGSGNNYNQLCWPFGIDIDYETLTIYIADYGNHRIMAWKPNATNGVVIAGANGKGKRRNQFDSPTDVIFDKKSDSLIVCDSANRRIMRWYSNNHLNGETLVENIDCFGLKIHNDTSLYAVDYEKNEVKCYQDGKTNGKVIAGGNGAGAHLNQLQGPRFVFVNQEHTVYISDCRNHRIIKWCKNSIEGTIVAGGKGQGPALNQLNSPQGIYVDGTGAIYVSDYGNHRVMRLYEGETYGTVIVGGNGKGQKANQLNCPIGLTFDQYGDLYVADKGNDRIQRFSIEK